MTGVDNGGDLWRTLSKEEDLLQGVLLQLDPVSLVNLEMVCINFREFMQRTQTWKKKFELSDQSLKNHVKDASESDHIQYKRRCLKLMNLEVNLRHGHCRKTKTELPKVFGNYNSGLFNHSLKAMHPDLVFVEGILRDLENSLVFDVREGRRKTLNPPPFPGLDCRVRSVDVSSDQVCLLRTPSPEHPEETFCILETYSVNAFNDNEFSLSSQSDPLERDEFGVGIKAKLAEEERILVLSFNMFGNAPIDMHGRVNIFEIDANHPTSPHPQKLVVTRRIKCFSDDLFSKLSVFDANYLVGCAGPEDQVEIWNLNADVGGAAEKVWTKRVVTEVSIPAVRISALEFRSPFLFVGKSNARVEVWQTERDELLQTLGHGLETGLKMDLVKISVQDKNVLCLTEAGWIFCWDWDLCTTGRSNNPAGTEKRKKKKKRKDEAAPNWVKKAKPGMPILTFVPSSTSILSLEGGVGRRYMYLVERDFLNHVEKEKNQDSCQIEKRSVEQSQKKSKLPRIEEFPSIDLDERPTDEEDIIVLDEANVDSEDVIFLDSMESSKDPEREKFCLKWNEYENNISATFKELRGDNDFADVTLVSDENLQLEVHKIILAASSPFFSSLLRKNKRDDVHPLIYLRGVKDKELKTVVDFMYHGEVNVYQEDLQDFLTVAEELKLRGLRQEVEDVKDHCANGDATNMGRSFGGDNEDDMDEVILHPEQNMTGDTDDIADTEESFVENGRVVVEESDDIEEMIDAMMERGADGDWRCVSCGKTAGKYKNNLRKHVEIVHLDQKGKPCKFCGKTFKSRPNLYAHVRRCQQSPQNQMAISEQPSMLGFVPHERTEEDTSYGQMVPMDGSELDVNLMIDPEIEAKVTSLMIRQEATGDWICGECGKNSGKLKANLRKHVEAMHVEGFVLPCASCGRTFGSRNALQCHPCYRQSPHFSTPSIFTNTPGVSTPGFLCEICNKEFKTKQSLKVHKQAIHEGVKFNCEFCSHSATTKSNLKVHVQKKHTIAQPMYEQPLPAGAIQYI